MIEILSALGGAVATLLIQRLIMKATRVSYMSNRSAVMLAIVTEIDRAYVKHGMEQWSRHEFYGIIKEEFEEMQEEIFKGGRIPYDPRECEKEIIQVAEIGRASCR